VNAPEEPTFYSANDARTAVAEILSEWFDSGKPGECRRVFVGRWIAVEDISLALVPYHEEALRLSLYAEEVTALLTGLRTQYKAATSKLVMRVLRYIASNFPQPAKDSFQYWLSTAYFNQVINLSLLETSKIKLEGILYPSVQMKYHGDSVALFPSVVDQRLRFIDAQELAFGRLEGGHIWMCGKPPLWFAKRSRRFGF